MKFAVSSRFLYPLDVKEKGIRVVWQSNMHLTGKRRHFLSSFLVQLKKKSFLVVFVCMNTLNLETLRGTPTKFGGNMCY